MMKISLWCVSFFFLHFAQTEPNFLGKCQSLITTPSARIHFKNVKRALVTFVQQEDSKILRALRMLMKTAIDQSDQNHFSDFVVLLNEEQSFHEENLETLANQGWEIRTFSPLESRDSEVFKLYLWNLLEYDQIYYVEPFSYFLDYMSPIHSRICAVHVLQNHKYESTNTHIITPFFVLYPNPELYTCMAEKAMSNPDETFASVLNSTFTKRMCHIPSLNSREYTVEKNTLREGHIGQAIGYHEQSHWVEQGTFSGKYALIHEPYIDLDISIYNFVTFSSFPDCQDEICKSWQDIEAFMVTTIITGWWFIDSHSKHGKGVYTHSMELFHKIHTRKVVFTNEPSLFQNWTNTLVIRRTIPDMRNLTGKTGEEWAENAKLDTEKHGVELYYIWIGRAFLLKEVKDLNPFNTEWFFWMDIGAAREERNPVFSEPFYCNPNGFSKEKFNFFTPLRKDEFEKQTREDVLHRQDRARRTPFFWIQGGAYGGYYMLIDKFTEKWRSTVDWFFVKNRVSGKDQRLFDHMVGEDPELYHVYGGPNNYKWDRWFWFYQMFKDYEKPEPYVPNFHGKIIDSPI